MSDARSLLRAKKATATPKVDSPYATYTPSGELKCVLCAAKVIQWTAHTSSKQHRASLARAADDERKRADKKRTAAAAGSDGKKRKVDPKSGGQGGALPEGFFADPSARPAVSRSPSPPPAAAASSSSTSAPPPPPPLPAAAEPDAVDGEFDAFLASIASASSTAPVDAPADDAVEGRTTFSAAPVLVLPPSAEEAAAQQATTEETEQDRRRRLEREEREEIVARLEEEEQAQEEAFERVDRMKDRLRALKKKREEAKKAKMSE